MKPTSRRGQQGFSLIELMVAAVIFLVVSVAIFSTLSNNEKNKRATTVVDDLGQNGTYALFRLGNMIRSAGSTLTQASSQVFGCRVVAVQGGTRRLPYTGTFPVPFAGVGATIRAAPLLIYKNASQSGSDVLMVMEGTGGYEQVSQAFLSAPTASTLNLAQTNNILANDLLLVADANSGGNQSDCLIEQATSPLTKPSTTLGLSGTFYARSSAGTKDLSTFSASGLVVDIGNTTNNPPNFYLFGTDNNTTLQSYDLLNINNSSATTSTPIADEVLEMHALYWVDTDGNGTPDTWKDPGTAPYDIASLTAGTNGGIPAVCVNGGIPTVTGAAATLRTIRGVRIGLIMRGNVAEATPIQQTNPLVLFADIQGGTLTYTRNLSNAELYYRYRVFETTILIRNTFNLC